VLIVPAASRYEAGCYNPHDNDAIRTLLDDRVHGSHSTWVFIERCGNTGVIHDHAHHGTGGRLIFDIPFAGE
jgi:hypothetical protein